MPGRPDENGIPGLPEEWGVIRVPDDAAELEPLAVAVRRELRRREARERRLPYLVLTVTVVVTLIGMFAVPWLGGATRPAPQPTVTTTTVPATGSPGACGTAVTCADSDESSPAARTSAAGPGTDGAS
ncbi:hypothetical protein LX16_5225 [Stackebrandtia albiflava]|uniref:Uncharacterized protein n=1 Tax=Stackebrandtia albiflava TaxID=406432 RepID=A0A562ULJ8_9ACTN|nr:hypothetical protein [Stackebrandtia albiflava]TWJ06488.1 hypothetical protein LX16_5225 [Stackebrandtia albiflava]